LLYKHVNTLRYRSQLRAIELMGFKVFVGQSASLGLQFSDLCFLYTNSLGPLTPLTIKYLKQRR